jgi:hypothetical protein
VLKLGDAEVPPFMFGADFTPLETMVVLDKMVEPSADLGSIS